MVANIRRILVMTAAIAAMSTGCARNESAAIEVQAWARATPAGASVGGVYLTIENPGSADRLKEVSTPLSERAEIHQTSMEGGQMQMRAIEALEIPAGNTVKLEPGGMHLMLVGLKHPLQEGGSIPLTLVFEKGGTMQVRAGIAPIGAMAPADMSPEHSAHH